jgi:hypothetical protein
MFFQTSFLDSDYCRNEARDALFVSMNEDNLQGIPWVPHKPCSVVSLAELFLGADDKIDTV